MKVIYGHVKSFYYYAINRVYVVTQFHNIFIYTKYLSLINLFLLSHKISTPNITFQNLFVILAFLKYFLITLLL